MGFLPAERVKTGELRLGETKQRETSRSTRVTRDLSQVDEWVDDGEVAQEAIVEEAKDLGSPIESAAVGTDLFWAWTHR